MPFGDAGLLGKVSNDIAITREGWGLTLASLVELFWAWIFSFWTEVSIEFQWFLD
jgi:hypothetical protein